MELNKDRIIELTLKYLSNDLNEVERLELNSWLSEPYNKERFNERIGAENLLEGIVLLGAAKNDAEAEFILGLPVATTKPISMVKVNEVGRRRKIWMAAATVAIAFGTAGVIWHNSQKENKKDVTIPMAGNFLTPSRSRAILTLSDGSKIRLDDVQKGKLARQGNIDVVKEGDGQVAYKNGKGDGSLAYNTIVTPRGGQYQVLLSDGSKVWLDAGSSLRFPTMFAGGNKEVTFSGQGYFETKKDPKHPFIVRVGKMKVEVLGTSFNIMAFQEEKAITATLITGRVKVIDERDSIFLNPEQEVNVDKSGEMSIRKADIDQVLAWKNGFLEFDGADIISVMNAVSRWWDVDVRYKAGSDTHSFSGQLSKNLSATEVLNILTTSGYHFEVNGRIITVLP